MAGFLFILLGAVYLWKPAQLQRWFRMWITIQLFGEEGSIIYMRVLGVIMIIGGAGIIVWDLTQ